MHWPSWLTMFSYVGRLTNKLITTTCPQRRFWVFESKGVEKSRFRRFEIEDARVKTSIVWWRHRLVVKRRSFLPLILRQSVHLCCRKVREHGEWFYIKLQTHLQSLRERTPLLFAISDKHSGRLLNFLCCFLYLELGLSWVIHVWTSDFKLFQENENLKLSLGWAFAHSFKAPPWGNCGFCISCTYPSFFSTPSKPIFLFIAKKINGKKIKKSPQNELRDWKKYVKIVHETVVNGVYSLLCQRPTCKTGSNDSYFKRIFKRCKNM